MNTNTYDVIIIGAGPAGSLFARLLDPKLGKVLVIDKRINEEGYLKTAKPCSGLVAIPAQKYLANILYESKKNILASPSRLKIKIVDVHTKRQICKEEIIFNINRLQMEQELIDSIPTHIEVLNGTTFIGYQELENGLKEVDIAQNKNRIKLVTKILVGADGANSKIRRKILPNDSIEKYTGIEWVIKSYNSKRLEHFNIILDKQLTDYYLWAFPKNDTILIGGIFKKVEDYKKIPDIFIKHLQDLNILQLDFEMIHVWAHPILRPNGKENLIYDNKNGIYLIGEAAGLVCPTSAEGYSYAFSSAEELAKKINGTTSVIGNNNARRILKKRIRKYLIYNVYIRAVIFRLFGKKY